MHDVFTQGDGRAKHSWLRILFSVALFLLVFSYPWNGQTNWMHKNYYWSWSLADKEWEVLQDRSYFLVPDSPTYIYFGGWLDPWRAHRSIGYPAFLYPFIYKERQKFIQAFMNAAKSGIDLFMGTPKPIYNLAEKTGIALRLETIVLVQRLFLALGIAVFYLSLCRWFPSIYSCAALLAALWLAPPPDPRFILTEPLSTALTWFCAAFLLFAPRSRWQRTCFALACLCASVAYLVRPQTLSLTALCSLIFLYHIYKYRIHGLCSSFVRASFVFSPLLLAYGYIGWLSIMGGQIFFHTHQNAYLSPFCYFAEIEDAANMPTERAKKLTIMYATRKAELMERAKNGEFQQSFLASDASPVRKSALLGDVIAYSDPFNHEIWRAAVGYLPLIERNILGRELMAGLRQRHGREMIANSWRNFLGALGWYHDVYFLGLLPRATFAINIFALILSVLTFAVCPKTRWPLSMMIGIHVIAIISAVVGHFVLGRYVAPTESLLLVAGMCSLRELAAMICEHWNTRAEPKLS